MCHPPNVPEEGDQRNNSVTLTSPMPSDHHSPVFTPSRPRDFGSPAARKLALAPQHTVSFAQPRGGDAEQQPRDLPILELTFPIIGRAQKNWASPTKNRVWGWIPGNLASRAGAAR